MGTKYAPLLAVIFLYSYEAEFIHTLLHFRNANFLWPIPVPFNRYCQVAYWNSPYAMILVNTMG
jgi:hypothetical protein